MWAVGVVAVEASSSESMQCPGLAGVDTRLVVCCQSWIVSFHFGIVVSIFELLRALGFSSRVVVVC